MRKKEKKYGRLYRISSFLGVLVAASGLIAVILIIWSWQKSQSETIQALNLKVDTMYSEKDMQSMISDAVTDAKLETEEATRTAMLDDIKAQLLEDKSVISILRPMYPDELIIAANGMYNFVPINDNLAKHALKEENLVLSEDGELTYEENGIVITGKGIDVSRYQGDIDWNKVKADGVDYAFIRVGLRGYRTGEINPDEKFTANIEGAHNAGIKVGVYFFTQAINVEEAIEEAEFVIEQLEPYSDLLDYPIALDVEKISSGDGRMNNLTKEERTNVVLSFCERIEDEGYTPMIYGNLEMFGLMVDMEPLEKYDKWYANYDPTKLYFPYDFKIWQYSSKGNVNGIKGDVDMNVSFKEW